MYCRSSLKIWIIVLVAYSCCLCDLAGQERYFKKSYALVVGIDRYKTSNFSVLDYAVKDARAIEEFLRKQDFRVDTLYNERATKVEILKLLLNIIAPKLEAKDRFLFFFSGHGEIETIGENEYGYIVPADAEILSATYISMEELRSLANKMGTALHLLFVLDCCYGGLLGSRVTPVKLYDHPAYINEAARKKTRQIITAGGKYQPVLDKGEAGHSLFTGHLLKGLVEYEANLYKDNFITASELFLYLQTAASNDRQTPIYDVLPGHEQGDFFFDSSGDSSVANTDNQLVTVYGTLKIEIPFPADIYIDNELKIRNSQGYDFVLPMKTYVIEIKNYQHRPFRMSVNVERGKTILLKVPQKY